MLHQHAIHFHLFPSLAILLSFPPSLLLGAFLSLPLLHPSTHPPPLLLDSPHPHSLHSKKLFQVQRRGDMGASEGLPIAIGEGAGAVRRSINERNVHLKLREGTPHPIHIQDRQSRSSTNQERFDRVAATSLQTSQTSNTTTLRGGGRM